MLIFYVPFQPRVWMIFFALKHSNCSLLVPLPVYLRLPVLGFYQVWITLQPPTAL